MNQQKIHLIRISLDHSFMWVVCLCREQDDPLGCQWRHLKFWINLQKNEKTLDAVAVGYILPSIVFGNHLSLYFESANLT